jgi:hypothetical protein
VQNDVDVPAIELPEITKSLHEISKGGHDVLTTPQNHLRPSGNKSA